MAHLGICMSTPKVIPHLVTMSLDQWAAVIKNHAARCEKYTPQPAMMATTDCELCSQSSTAHVVDGLLVEIIAQSQRGNDLLRERTQAREFGEEAAAKFNTVREERQKVVCAFCGEEYPRGTPRHGDGALPDHIKVCPQHPMRELESVLKDIIYASDGCVGHKDCNHSLKPWKRARKLLGLLRDGEDDGFGSIHVLREEEL